MTNSCVDYRLLMWCVCLSQELNDAALSDVQVELQSEAAILVAEQGKQERLAAGITEQVLAESQVRATGAR